MLEAIVCPVHCCMDCPDSGAVSDNVYHHNLYTVPPASLPWKYWVGCKWWPAALSMKVGCHRKRLKTLCWPKKMNSKSNIPRIGKCPKKYHGPNCWQDRYASETKEHSSELSPFQYLLLTDRYVQKTDAPKQYAILKSFVTYCFSEIVIVYSVLSNSNHITIFR